MDFKGIIDNYCKISIVGTFKNAGKTAALNELINIAANSGRKIGITSIGRDGERRDIVTNTDKPPIFAAEGTIIATAETCVLNSEASLEILNVTDFQTAIGRIVICRVVEGGFVEIAGPDSNSEINLVCDMMRGLGAETIMIDGALNRKTQASPVVADAVILSTGAVLGRSIELVVEKTVHMVKLLTLPRVNKSILKTCEEAATLNHVSFIDSNSRIINTQFKTALGSANKIVELIKDEYEYIVIPGTLVNSFIKSMQAILRHKKITLVVRDGTKVFVEPMDYNVFVKLGGRLEVIEPIKLAAVTVNPCSPEGYSFEPAVLIEAMKEALDPIDVFDVMQGGGSLDGVYE